MADNLIEVSERTAESVAKILHLLEGDEYTEGLIKLVRRNDAELRSIRENSVRLSISKSALISIAWASAFFVPFLAFADRMVLVSEIRKSLGLHGYQAVGISVVLDIIKLVALTFVMVMLILNWIGWLGHDKG